MKKQKEVPVEISELEEVLPEKFIRVIKKRTKNSNKKLKKKQDEYYEN